MEEICQALGLDPETELNEVIARIQSIRSEARNYPNLQLKMESLGKSLAELLPYAEECLLNINKSLVGELYPSINLAKIERARQLLERIEWKLPSLLMTSEKH